MILYIICIQIILNHITRVLGNNAVKKVRNKVSNGRQEPTELAREFKKQVQAKKNK